MATTTTGVRQLEPGTHSQAPYAAPAATGVRPPLRQPGGWREAGRSWDAAAERVRTQVGRGRWFRPARVAAGEAARLRGRAAAARQTGRALDALAGVGYVVFHDRVLAGTGEVLDHVLAGPPGVILVTSHPVTRLSRDPAGVLYDAGAPFAPELTALRWQAQPPHRDLRPAARLAAGLLPGGQPGRRAGLARLVWRPASMLTPPQLSWWAGTLPAPLVPMHVSDLALVVGEVCPPVSLV